MTVKAQICCNRAAETGFWGNGGTGRVRRTPAAVTVGPDHGWIQAAGWLRETTQSRNQAPTAQPHR